MGKPLKLIDNGDGTFSMATDIKTDITDIKVDADTINVNTDELESLLTTLSAKDFATQTTLAQIKRILDTDGIKKIIDPLPAGTNNIGKVDVNSSALPSGASTEAKQDNIISYVDEIESGLTTLNMKDFATSAKQDTIITHIDGVETALTTLNSKDLATQTTLAQILAKIIDAPATEAKQTELNALIGEVQDVPTANTLLARLKNLETKVDAIIADGIKLSGSNVELLTKTTITWDGTDTTNNIEVSPADGDVLIWINNTADQELTVTLEHEVEANAFAPYADGTGTAISFKVAASTGEGVYGPFQKFPKYLGGRVVLTAESAPTAAGTTTVQVQEV
jgi:hypothetical protein